ncbi:hypothetical protein ACU6RQ_17990 [Zobellella denitrificans]
MSYYIAMLLVALVYVITQYTSEAEGKSFRVEAGKVIVSAVIVFSSLYSAQSLNEQSQRERDSELAIRILYIASNEVDDIASLVLRLPNEFSQAVSLNSDYTAEKFMNDNAIEIPAIVNSALNDTNILRAIHPQSSSALYVALSNSKRALDMLNNRKVSRQSFHKLINQTNVFLNSLSEFMKYELMLQRGDITEEEFFDMHREHNKKTNMYTQSSAYN